MELNLNNPVIVSITNHLVNGILNEIAKHCSMVAELQAKGDLTPEALSGYHDKLINMIRALTPVLDFVKSSKPELVPLINLAESFASIKTN